MGWSLKILWAILKSVSSNFLKAKFRAKVKILKSWTKNVLIGFFWAGNWKIYCHRIFPKARSCAKMRVLKSSTKNALFGWFGQQFRKLLSYLESGPWNLSYCKVWCKKKKDPWICEQKYLKISYMGIFEVESENNIITFEISTLNFA